jgi:hypothetical protein
LGEISSIFDLKKKDFNLLKKKGFFIEKNVPNFPYFEGRKKKNSK